MNYETTPAIYLIKLLDVLKELNLPTDQLLDTADVSAVELSNREKNVALSKYLNVIEAASTSFDVADLGFRVGEHTTQSSARLRSRPGGGETERPSNHTKTDRRRSAEG